MLTAKEAREKIDIEEDVENKSEDKENPEILYCSYSEEENGVTLVFKDFPSIKVFNHSFGNSWKISDFPHFGSQGFKDKEAQETFLLLANEEIAKGGWEHPQAYSAVYKKLRRLYEASVSEQERYT